MTDDDREDPNPRAPVPLDAPKPPRVDYPAEVKRESIKFAASEMRKGHRVTAEEIAAFAAEYARRMGVAR